MDLERFYRVIEIPEWMYLGGLGRPWKDGKHSAFFSRGLKRTSPNNGQKDPHNDYKVQESVGGPHTIGDRLCKDHPLFDKTPERARAIAIISYQTLNSKHGPTAIKKKTRAAMI
ncbi:hypothetical protein BDV34DRAFT_161594 [Aspergillus parasiticus]|uniref:Uncharacterized protein n=1 Tax=Aspergillus parasiticus TaxID=5067 RepID=A0A5N6D9C1_ASPPA|nr:hypothetical protein BDV34DRAFT_161594 [Aspergillus parasiticus]